jgi:hypothetical protein
VVRKSQQGRFLARRAAKRRSPYRPIGLQDILAPAPKYLILPGYQYIGDYGKLSLSKAYVMNLHLYGLGGIGMIGIGDTSKPVLAGG